MSADPRGVLRGQCTVCSCDGYTRDSAGGIKCSTCGHPPPKHVNLSATANAGAQPAKNPPMLSLPPPTAIPRSVSPGPRPLVCSDGTAPIPVPPRRCRTPEPRIGPATSHLPPGYVVTSSAPRCIYPGCTNDTFFDPNSGGGSSYCRGHMDAQYLNLTAPLSSMYVTDGNSDPAMLQSPYTTAPAKALLWQTPAAQPLVSPPPLSPPTQLAPNMQLPFSPPTQQSPAPSLPDHLRCKYPQCNRPRYQEPNGKTHEFCGRRHAREYEKLNHTETTVAADMQCKTPQCTRPRRRMADGKGYYDFCSISCRDSGMASSSSGPCSLPGCTRPKYVDPANGRVHDYCGRTHAKEAQAKGIAVRSCNLTKLQPGSKGFSQVQALFQKKWAQAKGDCPTISSVFLVTNTQLETRWKQYQATLPVQGVEQYYHGTKLTCDIVTQCTACNDSDCGICGISQTGMDRRCIRKNINFQRFGHGFYLAPNSSKCHDYTQGVRKHRAMLQCDILPGKKHMRKKGDKSLSAPPQGCHSVYGQSGGELNYEELVVYNPDCVMPRYIIVYEKDGVHKIAK